MLKAYPIKTKKTSCKYQDVKVFNGTETVLSVTMDFLRDGNIVYGVS